MSDDEAANAGALDTFGAHLDPAMVVVTTTDGVERAGCVVGFHAQCSIDPDRYAIWLSKANHTYRVAMFADHVVVHLLGAADGDLAALFGTATGDEIDKFERCEWTAGPGGVPVLDRLPNRIIGRRISVYVEDDCDHMCVVLAPEVVETSSPFAPLRLSALTDLVPGHEAEDRPIPPSLRADA